MTFVWRKRTWVRQEPGCPARVFAEQHEEVDSFVSSSSARVVFGRQKGRQEDRSSLVHPLAAHSLLLRYLDLPATTNAAAPPVSRKD